MTKPNPPPDHSPKLLILVEGANDIQFLRRISGILHAGWPSLPDLSHLEQAGDILFIPFGGGDLKLWADRLAPLGKPELHIYDRETPGETRSRRRVQESVNQRRNCRAFVTGKRSLENYLHPAAIRDASGLDVVFRDDDCVPDVVARSLHARNHDGAWNGLPFRLQRRRRDRAKRWLNTRAVDYMSVERLGEQDPRSEVASWMKAIHELANI